MKQLLLATTIASISFGALASSFELSEDINAVMWNSIGKSDTQISQRINILEKAANPRTQAERDADAPVIKRYADTIVVDSLHVGAVGFPAGFSEQRFKLSLDDSHLKGFTLLSGTISNGDKGIGIPPLEAAADTTAFLDKKDDNYVSINTVKDVYDAHAHGQTGIALNVQGSDAISIESMAKDVDAAYAAGIRTSNIAYNVDNQYGRGGNSNSDLTLKGLTPAGEKLVTEYNRVGMVVDCSHSHDNVCIEAAEISTKPIIASHSNPRGLQDIPRNITDKAILAIAKTDGVIAVNFIGGFMNPQGDASSERIAEMVVYISKLTGSKRHVGMGVDFVHNYADALEIIVRNPERYSPTSGYGAISEMALPSDVWGAVVILEDKYGWTKKEVQGFLGHNTMRVYEANWKA